jgi:hypothetical protein
MGRAIEWKLGPTAVAALLVAMLSACASTSESVGVSSSLKDCEPGELRVCECLSGSGVQVCDDEGDDFGACECSDQGAGGNAAGGGGATSSSSSSATASSTGSGDPCAGQGHCGNSLQDCGETGVDCGSDCAACGPTPYTWDDCAGAGVSNGSEICDDSPFDVFASVPYVMVCMNANGGIGYVSTNTGPPDPNDGVHRCQGWEISGQQAWQNLQYVAQVKCDQEQKVVPIDLSGAAGGYLYFGVHDDPNGGGNGTGFCVAQQK